MRNLSILLLSVLIISCAARPPFEADTAFVNVNIISMADQQVQTNRTVLINNGRISQIAKEGAIQIPNDAREIDGKGGYLIPGLSEMHAHVPSGNADRQYTKDILFLYLSKGLTTIRGMLGDPLHLKLREESARGNLQSPRIYTAGPGFGGAIDSPEQARQQVRDQKQAGYNFLKIFPGLTLEEYNAIAEEANSVGIEFSGHIPASVGLSRALEAGQTTVDHLDKYMAALMADTANLQQINDPGVIYFGMHLVPYVNRNKLQQVASFTARSGIWNVPTQALLEHVMSVESASDMAQRPEFGYMPNETVKDWMNSKRSITGNDIYSEEMARQYLQLRRNMLKALHDAGAGILLGSDAPQIFNVPGFSAHDELRYLVEAGLSPFEALETGTVNTAEYLGDMESSGTIEKGKVADLVLLKANPLEDISNSETISGVMYRGNWLPKKEIEKRMQLIAGKYK